VATDGRHSGVTGRPPWRECHERYIHTGWPVDDLMKLYLTDSAPDKFTLDVSERSNAATTERLKTGHGR
jgi:hypothetical protein